MGQVFLQPGEVLEIETSPGDEIERAVTMMHRDADRLRAPCLVAWNEIKGDITIYGDDADRIAAIAGPVSDALTVGRSRDGISRDVFYNCETIDSIRVGDVHVFFDRVTQAKEPLPDEADREDAKGDWRGKSDADFRGASPLKVADAHEKFVKAVRALREVGLLTEYFQPGAEIVLPPGTEISSPDWGPFLRSMESAGLRVKAIA